MCYDKIIIEIKVVSKLVDEHSAQILNYLNATDFKLGILVNFQHCPVRFLRVLFHCSKAVIPACF